MVCTCTELERTETQTQRRFASRMTWRWDLLRSPGEKEEILLRGEIDKGVDAAGAIQISGAKIHCKTRPRMILNIVDQRQPAGKFWLSEI